MNDSTGAALAQLLLSGFTAMVDEVVVELAKQGHPGVTATHEFALTAIDGGADTASALGRSLGVTKQAAAKTIAALDQLGYVERRTDPSDARRTALSVTPRGHEMMSLGSRSFDAIRSRLVADVGPEALATTERVLAALGSPLPPGRG